MIGSKRRWIFAIAVALYLYFLLPTTAVMFYELYHLTGINAVYWGYSGFKIAGYYFGIWPYQWLACVVVAGLIVLVPAGIRKLAGRGRQS